MQGYDRGAREVGEGMRVNGSRGESIVGKGARE